MKIFISYRRADSVGHAGRLFDALQERFGRDNVFMDLSGIDSGADFAAVIQQAVGSCDALVAVIGDQWLTCVDAKGRRLDSPDDFVRREIAAALERGVPVVPVLIERTAMPVSDVLPAPLRALATRNAHELSDARWSYDVDRLIEALERITGRARTAQRQRWLVAAVAVAVLVAAAAGFVVWRTQEEPAAVTAQGAQAPASAEATPGPASPSPAAVADVAGIWTADVAYPWGATHPERFSFTVDGQDVLGTASFLRVNRGVLDGAVIGNRLTFRTNTQEILGDVTSDVTHRYRGIVTGNTIAFYMQTEGGRSTEPVEFTATRAPR